jgi:hypothetical protein
MGRYLGKRLVICTSRCTGIVDIERAVYHVNCTADTVPLQLALALGQRGSRRMRYLSQRDSLYGQEQYTAVSLSALCSIPESRFKTRYVTPAQKECSRPSFHSLAQQSSHAQRIYIKRTRTHQKIKQVIFRHSQAQGILLSKKLSSIFPLIFRILSRREFKRAA